MATLNTLVAFNGTIGSDPTFGLTMDANGDLFGTTETGGTSNDGTVFELVNTGSGYSAPVTLVNFTGSNGRQTDRQSDRRRSRRPVRNDLRRRRQE